MNNAFPVSHQVFEDAKFKKLSMSAKLVYIYLSKNSNRYADKDGWFWSSDQTIAENLGISVRSVSNAKRILRKTNFLDYKVTTFDNAKNLKTTVYRLNHFLDITKYGE